jgi:hypothetical protein
MASIFSMLHLPIPIYTRGYQIGPILRYPTSLALAEISRPHGPPPLRYVHPLFADRMGYQTGVTCEAAWVDGGVCLCVV